MPITVTHSSDVPGFPHAYLYGAPPPPPVYIGGVITDTTGAPVERTVRLYLRSTGALIDSVLSNSVTGEYEFPSLIDATEYDVVAIATGAIENDLILRVEAGSDGP